MLRLIKHATVDREMIYSSMAILLYLYSSVALSLAYWLHRPFHSAGVLLLFHLWYCAVFDQSNSVANFPMVALWKPLALILSSAAGGGMAYVLNMPRVLYFYVQPTWYLLAWLGLVLLQTASWLCWQLAPAVWWNYVFLGLVLQLAIIVASYFALPHDQMWRAQATCSMRVHYHFLVLSVLFTDVPYLVGSLVNPGFWPVWYAVIAGLAGICWALLHHFTAYDRPPCRIAYVGTEVCLQSQTWEDRYV